MVIVLIMFMHLLQPSIGQKGIAVYRKSVANINILSSIVKKKEENYNTSSFSVSS